MREPDLIWTSSDESEAWALVEECAKERRLTPRGRLRSAAYGQAMTAGEEARHSYKDSLTKGVYTHERRLES